MRKHKWVVFLIVALIVALVVYFSTFTVSFHDIAIVKTFGSAGTPKYGSKEAGLYFKWPPPIQWLVRYDARTAVFDDTADEIQTEDKFYVLVTVYCAWRIKDPNVFLRSIKTVEEAEEAIRQTVRSVKNAVVGTHPLRHFVNTDPKEMKLAEVEQEMRSAVQQRVEQAYGVEVVALGIKSFGLPELVTKTVINSMIEERNRYAEDYRSRGTSEAELIKSQAQAAHDQIMEFAQSLAREIETKGEEAAAEYYSAYEKDPQFAIYLRKLDAMKETLKANSVFIMTAETEPGVGYLRHGPGPALPASEATTRHAGPAPQEKD